MSTKLTITLVFLVLFIIVVKSHPVSRPTQPLPLDQTILGGVVPHHLYAKDIIVDFFNQLEGVTVDNVVLLGPNHLELGDSLAVTNSQFYLDRSPASLVQLNNTIIQNDQSMTSLIPFITQSHPTARLIPIALKYGVSLAQSERLAKEIAELPGRTLLIASVDFSHYLTTAGAREHDKTTLALLQSHRYNDILSLDSSYLDSPPSLVTALIYFKLQGAGEAKVLEIANSGETGNEFAPTTSYFSLLYTTSPTPSPIPIPTPSPSPTTLLFTGDVMLGRSVGYNISKNQDPNWPFAYVGEVLRGADITYINLENPLTTGCPLTQSGMTFCSEASNVVGLQSAGVDIASLANNHTTNYGQTGLSETISALTGSGISPVGLGKPVKLFKNGQTFTYLSFTDIGPYPGVANLDPATISDIIKSTKVAGEVLVVTFHWGHEYQSTPSARQVNLGHTVVEAGADLVIGAHPHWVQTHETYQGKPIYYSLGNFVFDQEWSSETKHGLVVRFTYDGPSLIKTEELPVLIENYGQPRLEINTSLGGPAQVPVVL